MSLQPLPVLLTKVWGASLEANLLVEPINVPGLDHKVHRPDFCDVRYLIAVLVTIRRQQPVARPSNLKNDVLLLVKVWSFVQYQLVYVNLLVLLELGGIHQVLLVTEKARKQPAAELHFLKPWELREFHLGCIVADGAASAVLPGKYAFCSVPVNSIAECISAGIMLGSCIHNQFLAGPDAEGVSTLARTLAVEGSLNGQDTKLGKVFQTMGVELGATSLKG